jgi:hypothetical protein
MTGMPFSDPFIISVHSEFRCCPHIAVVLTDTSGTWNGWIILKWILKEGVNWIHLAQDRDRSVAFVSTVMSFGLYERLWMSRIAARLSASQIEVPQLTHTLRPSVLTLIVIPFLCDSVAMETWRKCFCGWIVNQSAWKRKNAMHNGLET